MTLQQANRRLQGMLNNVTGQFAEFQLAERTILPAFLSLGGFTRPARTLCAEYGIGTAERIAQF